MSREDAKVMAQEQANKLKKVMYVMELEPGKFFSKTMCQSMSLLTDRIVPVR